MLAAFHRTFIAELINNFLLCMISFIIFITVIGFCKSAFAWLLGEKSYENYHSLSLNPLVHADIFGAAGPALALALFSHALGGSPLDFTLRIIMLFTLNSYVYHRHFNFQGNYHHLRLAGLNLISLFVNLLVFAIPLPVLLQTKIYYPISDNIYFVLYSILSTITTFALLRLAFQLPPLPGREFYYVIKPLLNQRAEALLMTIQNNMFYAIIFIIITVPLLLTASLWTINLLVKLLEWIFSSNLAGQMSYVNF